MNGAAIVARCHAEGTPEVAPHVALVREPGLGRRLRGHGAGGKQDAGPVQPMDQPIGVGRHSGVAPNPADESLAADPKFRGNVSNAQAVVRHNVRGNIRDRLRLPAARPVQMIACPILHQRTSAVVRRPTQPSGRSNDQNSL